MSAPHIHYFSKPATFDQATAATVCQRNGNPTQPNRTCHSSNCQIRRSAGATHTVLRLSFATQETQRKKNIVHTAIRAKVYKNSLLEVAVAERRVRAKQSIYVWMARWITTQFHIKGTIFVCGCWFLRKCRFNVVHKNFKNQVKWTQCSPINSVNQADSQFKFI